MLSVWSLLTPLHNANKWFIDLNILNTLLSACQKPWMASIVRPSTTRRHFQTSSLKEWGKSTQIPHKARYNGVAKMCLNCTCHITNKIAKPIYSIKPLNSFLGLKGHSLSALVRCIGDVSPDNFVLKFILL